MTPVPFLSLYHSKWMSWNMCTNYHHCRDTKKTVSYETLKCFDIISCSRFWVDVMFVQSYTFLKKIMYACIYTFSYDNILNEVIGKGLGIYKCILYFC